MTMLFTNPCETITFPEPWTDYLALADVGGWHLDFATAGMRLTPGAARVLGSDAGTGSEVLLDRDALYGKIHWRDRAEVQACWDGLLAGRSYETAYRLLLASGETRWICESARVDIGEAGRPSSVVGVVQDVTRRRLRVLDHAERDALTGLPGRHFIGEHLDHLLSMARRRKVKLAVLFVDLDRFKQVNDRLGHAAGDVVLREAARRMQDCLREGDIVGRQGGDEFIVVLPEIAHESDSGVVALRLLEALSAPFEVNGREVRMGASIGIAVYPDDALNSKVLLNQADMAMYRSKMAGRDTLSFFEPAMATAARERTRMEEELRSALANGDFVLHYQPIYDSATQQLRSVEALVRWQHVTRGLLDPGQFLPFAEESGFIRELGRWVLREVCWQLAHWRDEDFLVSLNVSAIQIPDDLSVNWLRETIRKSGIDPSRLIFEITETAPVLDSQAVRNWFEAVREMGIRVALDDFGTGHSSFAYLQCLRPRHLKIDKSFVQRMGGEPDQLAVVKAMIALGQTMGLTVTAEGVEDDQTLTTLRGLGCDWVQGFHLARPLPAPVLSSQLMNRQVVPGASLYRRQGAATPLFSGELT